MFPAGLGSQKPRFANQQRLCWPKPGSNNIVGGCSMWNPPTALPFVCEIHKLNCPGPLFKNTLILRGACITTICLNLSLQPTEKEKSYKRSPWETHFFEALSQTKLKIPMLMTMTSTPPWQRNEETATKTKLMPRPAVSLQKSKQKQL